jgi:general secretion pathway protein E
MKHGGQVASRGDSGGLGLKAQPRSVETAFIAFLVAQNFIESGGAQRALAAHGSTGQQMDTVLLELGLLPETKLADAMAAYLGLQRMDIRDFPAELPQQSALPLDFLRGSALMPVQIDDAEVVVATARPFVIEDIEALGYFLGRRAKPVVAIASELRHHLGKLLAEIGGASDPLADSGNDAAVAQDDDIERLRDIAREAPVVRLLNRLVVTAIERKASDIHVEPLEDQVRIRMRIDGALLVVEAMPKQLQAGLISRVKILARLNIAEQRLPQDGRFRIPVHGRDVDLRISTAPTLYGESIALRILDRQEVPLDFHALGYAAHDIARMGELIGQPNGIVLLTGPTGSGKTTTLYAALATLNRPESKIFTVEDPVEYNLKGINQIHVRPQIGLDFASVLRSILRQDPDIIMVGEIRDLETARISVQAALTGHLVLSTLHTNSAAASVARLIDMGIDDFMLVSCLRGIVAQRLVRRLCPACRRPHEPSPELRARLAVYDASPEFHQAHGCASCHNTGFKGRTVIYEVMRMNGPMHDAILRHAPESELEALARKDGMATLFETGMAKAAKGETTIDEILRIVAAPAP